MDAKIPEALRPELLDARLRETSAQIQRQARRRQRLSAAAATVLAVGWGSPGVDVVFPSGDAWTFPRRMGRHFRWILRKAEPLALELRVAEGLSDSRPGAGPLEYHRRRP